MKDINFKFYITTLGCSKNLVDSELLVNALEEQGMRQVEEPEEAEVIIINTCGFIEASQQESINAILEAAEFKKNGSCRYLAVTGCLSQRFGKELGENLPEIDIILGTGNFLQLPGLLRNKEIYAPKICRIERPDFSYQYPGKRTILTPRHSVYLKIAEGCSNCCSYCVIPEIRGAYRSRPEQSILTEAQMLIKAGAREINLIAQDTSGYGEDMTPRKDLPGLLEDIAAMEGIGWLRFLYTYPTKITKRLLKVVRDCEPVCRYMDIPLQHVNETILRNMNRKGSAESLYALISSIRDVVPDITLRTTFIVGFPGETRREFDELVDFVDRVHFDWVGVFPFSPQEGTPAYSLEPAVSEQEACRRVDELMKLQLDITRKRNMRWLNRRVKVLVEGKSEESPELFRGRTQGQAPEVDGIVFIKGANEENVGNFLDVKITHIDNYDLSGVVTG